LPGTSALDPISEPALDQPVYVSLGAREGDVVPDDQIGLKTQLCFSSPSGERCDRVKESSEVSVGSGSEVVARTDKFAAGPQNVELAIKVERPRGIGVPERIIRTLLGVGRR